MNIVSVDLFTNAKNNFEFSEAAELRIERSFLQGN